jgi:rhodanese-related sulfurtransferase
MRAKQLVLGLAAAALLPLGMNGQDAAPAEKAHPYKTISGDELKTLVKNKPANVVVVDARSAKYDDGRRIPGAVSLSASAPDTEINSKLKDKNTEIVAYCSNLKCPASAELLERLSKKGYTNLKKYPEGIDGWTKDGGKTEKASP